MFLHKNKPLIIIKGTGEFATAIACRLFRCGFNIIMSEQESPLVLRRKTSFAEALYEGKATVDGVTACLSLDMKHQLPFILEEGSIAVLVDPDARAVNMFDAEVVIDARMARRNLGTNRFEAPLVVGIGPVFTAGDSVHAVVETRRGQGVGRVIYKDSEDSAVSKDKSVDINDNYTDYTERFLKAPLAGFVKTQYSIGDRVEAGDVVAYVDSAPVEAKNTGILRGLVRERIKVEKDTDIAEIDPDLSINCNVFSVEALAVSGGALEAVFHYYSKNNKLFKQEDRG